MTVIVTEPYSPYCRAPDLKGLEDPNKYQSSNQFQNIAPMANLDVLSSSDPFIFNSISVRFQTFFKKRNK